MFLPPPSRSSNSTSIYIPFSIVLPWNLRDLAGRQPETHTHTPQSDSHASSSLELIVPLFHYDASCSLDVELFMSEQHFAYIYIYIYNIYHCTDGTCWVNVFISTNCIFFAVRPPDAARAPAMADCPFATGQNIVGQEEHFSLFLHWLNDVE